MSEKPSLSVWDYVTFPVTIIRIGAVVLWAGLTSGFRGPNTPPTARRHILYTFSRTVIQSITLRQYQAIFPLTVEAYEASAKARGFKPEIVEIGDGTLGCWIGDNNAKTVLIWFHGGGYALPASPGHMDFLSDLVSKTGSGLAALVLAYDLIPQGKYPRQLEQASATIRYLTQELGKSYSDLLVGGDSAGAHLAISLLSHLSHPHPTVPALQNNAYKFKGAILISPVVTFDQSAQAFERNKQKDSVSSRAVKSWFDGFMGSAPIDNYNTPLNAPVDWWNDIQAENLLILAGTDEVFVDDIQQFAEKIEERNTQKVELLIAPGEGHNSPIHERNFGLREKDGAIEAKMCQWVIDRA
ncbi:Alpha/Beta hydrolase protein [Hypoxylon crocopeplum]|nr:Alpha/Beta hydrolase protein [Hypoxylon crocopeplum]